MRVLIPRKSDVWLVGVAMVGTLAKLLRDGVEVLTYDAAMLHSKTVILDGRVVVIASHNVDTLSWRFNLEANVVVDAAFATAVLEDTSATSPFRPPSRSTRFFSDRPSSARWRG